MWKELSVRPTESWGFEFQFSKKQSEAGKNIILKHLNSDDFSLLPTPYKELFKNKIFDFLDWHKEIVDAAITLGDVGELSEEEFSERYDRVKLNQKNFQKFIDELETHVMSMASHKESPALP